MFTKENSNFCKGIAILLMIFHHLYFQPMDYVKFTVDSGALGKEMLTGLSLAGKICVAIFIFISGYGIAAVYRKKFGDNKPSAKELSLFTWKRYWNLMTGYWFVFVLILICQPLGRSIQDAYGFLPKDQIIYGMIDFMGLAHLFGTPTINPPWWYISMAVIVILIMPFVMRIIQSVGASLTCFGSVIFLFATRIQNEYTFYLVSMLLGVWCMEVKLFEKVSSLGKGKILATAGKVLVEAVCFLLLLSIRRDYPLYGVVDAGIALCVALLVHALLIKVPVLTQIMQALGKYSTGMYHVHYLLHFYYFMPFFFGFEHWAVILLVVTVVTFITSVLIEVVKKYSRYEKLMMKIGDRILG